MIDQRALLAIATGATAQATDYIFECLQIDPDPKVPMSDEQHQAFITASMFTIVVLETTLKQNLRNPEAQAKLRGALDELSTRIASMPKKSGFPS